MPRSDKSRRKKEGAFYTPAFITRYIIEQALGGVLRDRFEQLRQAHQEAAKGAARAALADPRRLRAGQAEEARAGGPGAILGSVARRIGRRSGCWTRLAAAGPS